MPWSAYVVRVGVPQSLNKKDWSLLLLIKSADKILFRAFQRDSIWRKRKKLLKTIWSKATLKKLLFPNLDSLALSCTKTNEIGSCKRKKEEDPFGWLACLSRGYPDMNLGQGMRKKDKRMKVKEKRKGLKVVKIGSRDRNVRRNRLHNKSSNIFIPFRRRKTNLSPSNRGPVYIIPSVSRYVHSCVEYG